MGRQSFDIELLGTSCCVDLWEDREYLNFISNIWKKQLKETETKTGEVDPLKISIVAGLEIVDKLVKSRKVGDSDILDPEDKVHNLIGELDSVLIDE